MKEKQRYSKLELINATNNIFRLSPDYDTVKNINAHTKIQKDILKGKIKSLEVIRKRAIKHKTYY